jgi:hypothetical protein
MHASRPLAVVALCLALAGCSSDAGGAEPEPQDDDEVVDARAADKPKDAGDRTRDARPLDASKPRPIPQAQCSPGQYDGDFSCLISGLLPWAGKMSFALVEKSANSGEFTTLQIVPGTQISGNDDSFSGMFTATLEGEFDCQTGQLTGQLADGLYTFGGFMNYQLHGPLEGSYRADGGTPGFDGKMGPLKSTDFDLYGELAPYADCTWSAVRTGDASGDAGR